MTIEGLRPYPEYRKSGVEWLEDVPEHWDVMALRHRYRVELGKMLDSKRASGMHSLPYLRNVDVQWDSINTTELPTMDIPPSELGRYTVRRGDLLVCEGGEVGRAALWDSEAIMGYQKALHRLRARRPTCDLPRFLFFQLTSAAIRGIFRADGSENTIAHLTAEKFRRHRFVFPPANEQAAIVRFLDHADRRIQRYIRAKERLIELLEEEKQAIIHRAVTRGLDPNVKLTQSGVEWLGDVPEHWEVVRFKRHVGFQEGPGIMAADFRDAGVPLLRISCLKGEVATLDGCGYLDPEMVRRRWAHFGVRDGDYLLSASASAGEVVPASTAVHGAIPYTGILRLWPGSNRIFMPFVRLWMSCAPFRMQMEIARSGATIEHFGPSHLRRMTLALPPLNEQKEMVERVALDTSRGVDAIRIARRQVTLLHELRTRLISDVVTGKLDVRETAAALPEDPEADAPALDHALEEAAA